MYVDVMILNPQTKLVICEEDSWSDINMEEYRMACRRRFVDGYEHREQPSSISLSSAKSPVTPSVSAGMK